MPTLRISAALLLALALALAACGPADDTPAVTEPDPAELEDADPDALLEDIEPVRLRISTLLPPGGSISGLMEWYLDELETRTGGAVSAEISYAGSLLPGPDTMAGVAEGRAEGGLVVPAYHPAELPLTNMIMVPVQGHNQGARPRAMQATLDANEHLAAEIEAQGIHIIGFTPNSTQTAAVTSRVETVDDYGGLRLRVPGIPAVGYAQIGVEPVFLSAEEVYEALQRGIIDGATFPWDVHHQTGTYEVADYLVDDGLGQSGMASFALNLELYESLPQAVKDLMSDLHDEFYDRLEELLTEVDREACDAFIANGNEIIVFPEAEQERMAEITSEAMFQEWRDGAIGAGVDEAVVDEVWEYYVDQVETYNEVATYENALEACAARM